MQIVSAVQTIHPISEVPVVQRCPSVFGFGFWLFFKKFFVCVFCFLFFDFTRLRFVWAKHNMDWKDIPSDHFSLPPDTICRTLSMLSDHMQPEDVTKWLEMLRSNQSVPHLQDLPTSRPSDFNNNIKLPGLGHPYWSTARDHIFAGSYPPKIPEQFITPLREVQPEHCAEFIARFKEGCNPTSKNPVYSVKWQSAAVQYETELGYHVKVEVTHNNPGAYQDGSPISAGITSFHGTREIALKSIFTQGLRSSAKAHKVVGLWLNDYNLMAATWNCSILDQTPFLFCQVLANPLYDRQNANIMQGQDTRRVSELRSGMTLPSVQITHLFIGIPHPARTQWRHNLFKSLLLTHACIRSLPLPHWPAAESSAVLWASNLYQLTAARVAYRETDGAMSPQFGGHFTTINTECIPISIAVTKLLDALQTVSEQKRIRKLAKFQMNTIPLPIREVFVTYFPELRVWTNWHQLTDYSMQWTMGPVSAVDQWFIQ